MIGIGNRKLLRNKKDNITSWLSTAIYSQTGTIYSQTSCQGFFFKPDGTMLFVTDTYDDTITVYNLSTAWDLSTLDSGTAYSFATYFSFPYQIQFKSDGTKMYVVDTTGDNIDQFSLSTAWNISTATYTNSKNVGSQNSLPRGVFLSPDGLKMWMVGTGTSGTAVGAIAEYNLSTAWNTGTAVYSKKADLQYDGNLTISFSSDGTRLFVTSYTTMSYLTTEYYLSTAWDIDTLIYLDEFYYNSDQRGSFLKQSDDVLYIILDGSLERIISFTLTIE